jgi:integrase
MNAITTTNPQQFFGVDPFATIQQSLLQPSTKAQYTRALEKYLATGASLTDTQALINYASGLKASARAFLKAALKLWAERVKTIFKGQATPENVNAIQASIYRLEALNEAIETKASVGTKAHTWLSLLEVKALLGQCDVTTLQGKRDKLALGLLVGAGLRREELAGLRFEDVKAQGDRMVLEVCGKGAKMRVIPISRALAAAIEEMKPLVNGGFIIRSLNNGATGETISGASLYNLTGKYGAAIGKPELQPHDLRRTYALIFNFLEETRGNFWGTAIRVNALGYTGSKGKQFVPKSIQRIATRKLYIGIFESKITDKVTHRPDLQIISLDQFNRVNELIKSRRDKSKNPAGVRGRYVLTGFVVCGSCGEPMIASKSNDSVTYHCLNSRTYGKNGCQLSKSYSEHLVLPPIVDFIAGLIYEQINIRVEMQKAAAQYGKTVTEEALEAAIAGELESVKAGKQRVVEAISLGVLTTQEAAAKLAELREHEQRLIVEIASVSEKTAITEQWQQALDSLEGRTKEEIANRLHFLAENSPVAFRRFMALVFEPNSLRVKTERLIGRKWAGYLEGYQLTKAIKILQEQYEQNCVFRDKTFILVQHPLV